MASNSMEWVEIIEPKTGEHMYANLTTGQCVWDPPEGVPVKRTDSNQWWELFDKNTSRFYYYNAFSQKTVWHKPQNCDIIPLAKLQTIKQNTDPESKSPTVNQATQTPTLKSNKQHHSSKNHTSSSTTSSQQHHHHHNHQPSAPIKPHHHCPPPATTTVLTKPSISTKPNNIQLTKPVAVNQLKQQSSQTKSTQNSQTPISLSVSTPQLKRRGVISQAPSVAANYNNNYFSGSVPTSSVASSTTCELSRSCSFASSQRLRLAQDKSVSNQQSSSTGASRPSLVSSITQAVTSTDTNLPTYTPLYSNCHEALQQYILSGYRYGDILDSDTGSDDHSFSGSESLTGHEPDNEDSDQSSDEDGNKKKHSYLISGTPQHRTLLQTTTSLSAVNLDNKNLNNDSDYINYYSRPHEPDKYLTYAFRNNIFTKESQSTGTVTTTLSLPSATAESQTNQSTYTFNSCPRGDKGIISQAPPTLWSEEQYYSIAEATAAMSMLPGPPEVDMEKFAQDNLNIHSKGLFRRKVSVRDMLSWSGGSISRPMLAAVVAGEEKQKHNKMARELFRLVQTYMGDRKPSRPGMTLNSVLLEILVMVFTHTALRDELYVQLCRQTTENPHNGSLLMGWELFAIALAFIPPSITFQPVLLSYLNRHYDAGIVNAKALFSNNLDSAPPHVKISHYAMVAINRLERIGSTGKRKERKPTEDDIQAARIQIFKTSMFGNTLTEVMNLQKERYPDRQLPWIQVVLSEQIIELDGANTEGIFRVSADVDEVNAHKAKLDQWELPQPSDAHVPANLLKLWYRELYEPLIPDSLYDECVVEPMTTERAANIVARLPRLNRLVLNYLIRFLQGFSQAHVVAQTKMDASNLAMVFAPNCLRCTAQDPRVIFENARKEMGFIRCLIEGLDTSCVKDMI